MKMKILVLGVTHFNGMVEGKQYRTAKVLYTARFPKAEQNKKGLDVCSISIPYDDYDSWTAPAWFEVDVTPSTKGFDIESHKLDKKLEISDFVG